MDFEEWYEKHLWWADKQKALDAWHAARDSRNQVAAAIINEREACAMACEGIGKEIVCPEECAEAIRMRSNAKVTGAAPEKG